MKKIIYGDEGREHVVGTAANWTQVYEVCSERGLRVAPVGSEGPDAFYVSPMPRKINNLKWPPQSLLRPL